MRKKGCHPHKHRFFLKTQLFLRGKANCRSIIIWNIRFIRNTQGQSRFETHRAHRQRALLVASILTEMYIARITLRCSTGRVFMALRLNLQPQRNTSFWKPEENNSNSVISYQSGLSLQPANQKSVALDYKEVRWYHFVQTCMKDNCAKKPCCAGGTLVEEMLALLRILY